MLSRSWAVRLCWVITCLWPQFAYSAPDEVVPHPNVVGGKIGLVVPFSDYSVRIGDPVNLWGTRSSSLSLGAFYFRKLTRSFWLGATLETESVKATSGDAKAEGQRNAIGIAWLGHYPDGVVSFEAGGFGSLRIAETHVHLFE